MNVPWRKATGFELCVFLFGAPAAIMAQGPASTATPPVMRVHAGSPINPRVDRARAAAGDVARNEAAIIDLCRSYVEAQLIYSQADHDADRGRAFAQKIRSAAGRRDGLYWPLDADGDESPIGPNFAAAAAAEQPAEDARPFFGYFFKVLLSQGAEAPGGAREYRVEGRLTRGFALVAWPANYGLSGVRSFLVSHLGDVYAKDMGPETQRVARDMPAFAPDRSWFKVASNDDMRGESIQ